MTIYESRDTSDDVVLSCPAPKYVTVLDTMRTGSEGERERNPKWNLNFPVVVVVRANIERERYLFQQ